MRKKGTNREELTTGCDRSPFHMLLVARNTVEALKTFPKGLLNAIGTAAKSVKRPARVTDVDITQIRIENLEVKPN